MIETKGQYTDDGWRGDLQRSTVQIRIGTPRNANPEVICTRAVDKVTPEKVFIKQDAQIEFTRILSPDYIATQSVIVDGVEYPLSLTMRIVKAFMDKWDMEGPQA